MAGSVRTGGKGSVRRCDLRLALASEALDLVPLTPRRLLRPASKFKAVHKTTTTDDKRLQNTLKRLSVNTIPGCEEVNIFFQDDKVIHFSNPKGASPAAGRESEMGAVSSRSHARPLRAPHSAGEHCGEHLRGERAVADEECAPGRAVEDDARAAAVPCVASLRCPFQFARCSVSAVAHCRSLTLVRASQDCRTCCRAFCRSWGPRTLPT